MKMVAEHGLHKVWKYLTDESENKIVDRDISVECQCKANQQYQMVYEYGRNPAAVKPIVKHIPLIISKVSTREA